MISFGGVPIGSVLPIPFASYAGSSGASITLTGLAVTDIEVYKGTSVIQRASDAGFVLIDTDGIDIDGITGIHGFSIDTGDNTDAGFYAAGSFYSVIVSGVTVDAQTVNFIAATFRLVAAENTAGIAVVDTVRLSGVAQTARDIGASVLLSNGVGTGQVKLAAGYVAMTWADIAAPTSSVNLSGTTIATSQVVASVTGAVGSVVGLTPSLLDVAVSTLATAANLAIVASYIDTEMAAALAVLVKVDSAMVLDGAVYQFTANALALAPTGGSAPTAQQITEYLLDADLSTIPDTGTGARRTMLQALRALRNRFETPGGVYTVYKEDDATIDWTGALTATPLVDPTTGMDPAGP